MKQQQKKSIQLWVRKRIISMCFKNVSRAFDDLHGLLFLQRKNYYGVVPWKPDGILNLLKKSLYGILLLLLWKKKFVLDIPDLAFSSDLFFERNQLEDNEEEFFFWNENKECLCVSLLIIVGIMQMQDFSRQNDQWWWRRRWSPLKWF